MDYTSGCRVVEPSRHLETGSPDLFHALLVIGSNGDLNDVESSQPLYDVEGIRILDVCEDDSMSRLTLGSGWDFSNVRI